MKDPQRLLEDLDGVLEALSEAAKRGPIIVEGRRDAEALESLGLGEGIEVLNNGQGLLDRCEDLARGEEEVTILTDWDAKGEELARRLQGGLARTGVRTDLDARRALRRLTRGSVHAVEELDSFYRRVEAAARSKGKERPPPETWRVRRARKAALRAARQRHAAPRGSKR